MKINSRNKKWGISRKTQVLVASTVVAFLVVSVIGIGVAGYQLFSATTAKYSETFSTDNNLVLRVKENILGPLVTAGNEKVLAKSLTCFSLITGQDSRSILTSLANATSNEALSQKAVELAETMPEQSVIENPDFVNGLRNCVKAYLPQT